MEDAKRFIGDVRPHHKFRPVADAAAEIGLKDFYERNCKVLSKYVHPTAMSVVAHLRGKGEDIARKQFFDWGIELAEEALQKLDSSYLGDVYRKYRSTMNNVLAKLPAEMRPFQKPV
ncbi:MAG: hypothetical protein FJ291_26355 [Planctomycetes bacterium]|nr:hypothetical protein [Planctomycetota bacterium]